MAEMVDLLKDLLHKCSPTSSASSDSDVESISDTQSLDDGEHPKEQPKEHPVPVTEAARKDSALSSSRGPATREHKDHAVVAYLPAGPMPPIEDEDDIRHRRSPIRGSSPIRTRISPSPRGTPQRSHFPKLPHKSIPILTDSSLNAMTTYIKTRNPKNIIVLSGAGTSTSAGIPDFRTPGTGLYSNLKKYNLPYPEAVFDIDYFKTRPEPFYTLARELWPGNFNPTLAHYFIRLLAEKQILLRNYTQNIDTLERIAGIPDNLLVEAHGSFHTSKCVGHVQIRGCGATYDGSFVKDIIFKTNHPIDEMENTPENRTENSEDEEASNMSTSQTMSLSNSQTLPLAKSQTTSLALSKSQLSLSKSQTLQPHDLEIPTCPNCSGIIKPAITFFGEPLPTRFFEYITDDFEKCDLLIVMGTSLSVAPFCELINYVKEDVPRFLINLNLVGECKKSDSGVSKHGFDFQGDCQRYRRDGYYLGTCDIGVWKFCQEMGWDDELKQLFESETGLLVDEVLMKQSDMRSEVVSSESEDYELVGVEEGLRLGVRGHGPTQSESESESKNQQVAEKAKSQELDDLAELLNETKIE